MAVYLQKRELDLDCYIRLHRALAVGSASEGRSSLDRIRRADGAEVLGLQGVDQSVQQVGSDTCQVFVGLEGSAFFVEDRNPEGNCAFLNNELFTRRKLLINDRITIGEHFHFRFDGLGLQRVSDKQGARLVGSHLTKIYSTLRWPGKRSEVAAIRDVSVNVEPNEFVGILGPSGCGKSTLLNVLSGALKPTSGTVTINSVDIRKNPKLIRSMVGVVPQDDIVHGELSVGQAVGLSARLRLEGGISRQFKEDLATKVICDLGLSERRRNRISELSGGQRKRASIAVEVLKQCDVLFLDEPSSGLDPATEEDLMNLLSRLAEQGRTILCTTHVLDRAYLFSKILFMSRGGLVFEGTVDDALNYFEVKNLLDAYRMLDDPSFVGRAGGLDPAGDWWSGEVPGAVGGARGDLDREEAGGSDAGESPLAESHFEFYDNGGVARLVGEFDADTRTTLLEFAGKLSGTLVLDCSGLRTGTMEVERHLFDLYRELNHRGVSLIIASPPADLADFIKENRFERTVRLRPDLRNALLDCYLGEKVDEWVGVEPAAGLSMVVLGSVSVAIFAAFVAVIFLLVQKRDGREEETASRGPEIVDSVEASLPDSAVAMNDPTPPPSEGTVPGAEDTAGAGIVPETAVPEDVVMPEGEATLAAADVAGSGAATLSGEGSETGGAGVGTTAAESVSSGAAIEETSKEPDPRLPTYADAAAALLSESGNQVGLEVNMSETTGQGLGGNSGDGKALEVAVDFSGDEEINPLLKEAIGLMKERADEGGGDGFAGLDLVDKGAKRDTLIEEIMGRIEAAPGYTDKEKMIARQSVRDARLLAKILACRIDGNRSEISFDQEAEVTNLFLAEPIRAWADNSETVFVVLGYAPKRKQDAQEYSRAKAESVAEFMRRPPSRVSNRIFPLGLADYEVRSGDGNQTAFEIWAVIP